MMPLRCWQLECRLNRSETRVRKGHRLDGLTGDGVVARCGAVSVDLLGDEGDDLTDGVLIVVGEQLYERIVGQISRRCLECGDEIGDGDSVGNDRHGGDVQLDDTFESISDHDRQTK